MGSVRHVAVSGNTAVVGAWQANSGRPIPGEVYVYERNFGGPDAWGEVAVLQHSNSDVAIQGNRIVVGGRAGSSTSIFERNAGGPNAWGQVAELVPMSLGNGFGASVALDGDRIVVGAFASRATHVFERDGLGVWSEVALLQPGGCTRAATLESPSRSMATASSSGTGRRARIPERGRRTSSSAMPEARVIGGSSRSCNPPRRWVSSDPSMGAEVDVEGDLLAVGGEAAAVFVYDCNTGGSGAWGELKRLTSFYQGFGTALDLDGDRLAVGVACPAPGWPCTVFVYERHLGGENAFGELARVTDPADSGITGFGLYAALSGGHLLVGAYDDELANNAGAAYVYRLSAGGNLNNAGKQIR